VTWFAEDQIWTGSTMNLQPVGQGKTTPIVAIDNAVLLRRHAAPLRS
jgi:hypothetical protein